MTTRTQISLPPEEHRRARLRAAEQGVSLAEYVRQLVAQDLALEQSSTSLSEIFDLGDSGGADVGRYKDRYIADAVDRLNR